MLLANRSFVSGVISMLSFARALRKVPFGQYSITMYGKDLLSPAPRQTTMFLCLVNKFVQEEYERGCEQTQKNKKLSAYCPSLSFQSKTHLKLRMYLTSCWKSADKPDDLPLEPNMLLELFLSIFTATVNSLHVAR